MGMAQAIQAREKKEEEARALMQQYNLLTMKQRADQFKAQLEHNYAMQQIAQKAFMDQQAKIREQQQKIDDERRFWDSPEGKAKVDYWEQRAAAEEARARNFRTEKRTEDQSAQKSLRADVDYLDRRMQQMVMRSKSATGEEQMRIAPGYEAEYQRLKAVRDQRLKQLGIDESAAFYGPPAPSFNVQAKTAGAPGGSAPAGQPAAATSPQANDDPLGLRGLQFGDPDMGGW
jgi:hypothetical protein